MSPRRLLIALGLASGALVATGAAMLPWPVGTPTAAAFVSRGLREYGLSLTAEGPATMTLLPLPRLAFARTRVSTAAPGGLALIEGGGLAIELNPLALLTGRPDIGSLALTGATIHLPRGADDPHWAEPLRRVAGRIAGDGSNHPRRVILTDVTLDAEDGAQDLDLTLAWPIWSGTAEAAASLTWRGARTDLTLAGIRVADILNRRDSPFSLTAAWPAGTLAAAGTASFADGLAKGLALSGRGRLQTRSLPETLAWVGGEVALAPFIRAFSLDGRFETAGRRISLPSVRATLGDDVLDGAGSVSLGEARTSVQATLAAESLNLAPLLAGLVGMFGGEGDGAARPVALAPLTGGDLDLRISAAGSRIGPVMLEDLAASVLVREGAVEVALGRAAVQGGTLKGRVTLTASGEDGGETEVKAQGVLDRLDLGALVADLGEARWLLGGTQGQFAASLGGPPSSSTAA